MSAAFLEAAGWGGVARVPLAGDASARRYWRLQRDDGACALLMDASATGDLERFQRIADLLRSHGIRVPAILNADTPQGLALLEDLGDGVFAGLLEAGAAPEPLFDLAVDVLIHLHRHFAPPAEPLPVYDAALFIDQLDLFLDEVAPAGDRGLFENIWRDLLGPALAVPISLLHRDYHAGNLIRCPGARGIDACAVIDFQDAGLGPVTYDLASLVEDARRDVPDPLRRRAVARYLAAFPDRDGEGIEASLAVLALMRHLRVVAIFRRLARRDGKRDYLVHLPRLEALVRRHLSRPECASLAAWFQAYSPI